MDYQQTLRELYSLDSPVFRLGISRTKALLKKLGNPEKKIKCIHVAGTNGKGSVCAMLNSMLTEAGYKTGMYTSPHLKRFNERIRINNRFITDREIAEYYSRVKKYATNQSFFEITTAMAILYFYEKKVDFAILEVGLGGRLDATNVINPVVSVITNVSYDHSKILGKSLSKIAYEKAGIIKKNVPVVTATKGIALATIKKISNKRNSPLIIINKKTNYNNYENLKLKNLNAKFQIENAAIAVKAIEVLKNSYNAKISKSNIEDGLKNAKWPGRFQFIGKNILADCAHNPSGFKVLVKELKNLKYSKLILIAGFSNDKDIKTISGIIRPLADKVIITKSGNERAAEPETIKKYFSKNSVIIKDPKNALKHAKKLASKKDLILIAGSIFLVGEII